MLFITDEESEAEPTLPAETIPSIISVLEVSEFIIILM